MANRDCFLKLCYKINDDFMRAIIILPHNEIYAPLKLRKAVLYSIPAKIMLMGFNGLEDML